MKRILVALLVLIAIAGSYFFWPSFLPYRQLIKEDQILQFDSANGPNGKVWIEGGLFTMGSQDEYAQPDEQPAHLVAVDGFWMDQQEVTVALFDSFVRATGYKTEAELPRNEAQLKACWPEETPFDSRSINTPGSFVGVMVGNTLQWQWVVGANWRHPQGGSSVASPTNPVQHISWNDAIAFCGWQGSRLPTEAEWEYAALAGRDSAQPERGGIMPDKTTAALAVAQVQPVRSTAPNAWRLYDMAGNVAEWCGDWYDANYYKGLNNAVALQNPLGPTSDSILLLTKRVLKGGHYLSAGPVYYTYRPSAKAAANPSFASSTTGFRTIMSAYMWEAKKVLDKMKKK